jgi:hypothetical protein
MRNGDSARKVDGLAAALTAEDARDNKIKVEAILKEACLKWLDEDLLEQYTPLVISDDKELFNKWLKTKAEARATLQKLIDKGELKVRERTPDETGQDKLYSKGLYDSELAQAQRALELIDAHTRDEILEKAQDEPEATFSDRVITGESLYNLKGEFEFVKDFKKRVDEYNANLGIVYKDDDPEHKGEHLDQELLIADTNNKGELNIFSLFGLTTKKLKATFEATQFIKETTKNGETTLDFNNETLKTIFKEIRESLINGYAKLLAFEDIFKRLSKTYETDLTGKVKSWRESVGDFIDQHNDALSRATGQKLHGGEDNEEVESWLIKRRGVLKTKDDLFIDKEKITPNKDGLESYYTKFKDALGGDF